MQGTVKWFSPEKGYGFIAPAGGGNDVFVHITDVRKAGLQTLDEGAQVSFEMKPGKNGRQSAVDIKAE